MAQAAAKTGSGPTAMVAVEQYVPQEQLILIDDLPISIPPLGARILLWFISPRWARNWLIRFAETNSPGLWALVMCRKRFIDDKLLESVNCIGAVVNLGTGSDTRVYEATAFIVNMKTRPHGEPVFDTTNLREEWRTACHKLKLGMFDTKTRSYRGAQLHDFRRTAASNMNAKGIQEGKAMTVTGHKTNSMYKRYGIEELDSQRDALDAVTV